MLSSINGWSQSWGESNTSTFINLSSGVGLTDGGGSYFPGLSPMTMTTLTIGKMFGHQLGLYTGIGYSSYHYEMQNYDRYMFGKQSLKYLEVPFALHYTKQSSKRRTSFYADIGCLAGILVYAHWAGNDGNSGNTPVSPNKQNESDVKKLNIKPFLGCGFTIDVSDAFKIAIGMQGSGAFGEQAKVYSSVGYYGSTADLVSFSGKVGLQVRIGD